MKCPYRKRIDTVKGSTFEYFADCYEYDCPFYSPEQKYGNLIVNAGCTRPSIERGQKNE